MASSSESGRCILTSTRSGLRKPAVNRSICCCSVTPSQRARSLRNWSWYSATVPERRKSMSSPSGLLRTGGPKRILMSSMNMGQVGTPRLHSRR
uniref:Uncharacterized protein n=1 Tax=Arundo donax TaxID=35708 RepID=A0A0A9ADW5_ARUDO